MRLGAKRAAKVPVVYAMFEMIVDHAIAVPGRGVVVDGRIIIGAVPQMGAEIIVHAEGKAPTRAQLRGREMGFREPGVGLLLSEVTVDDVPPGTRITSG